MPDTQVPLAFQDPRIRCFAQAGARTRRQNRDIAEGDAVSRGTVLVRIRAAEYQDKVRQASSQAEAAKPPRRGPSSTSTVPRACTGAQSLTKPDFDAAGAQYDATQAELRAARRRPARLRSPRRYHPCRAVFNGDIVKKNVELGAFVGPGVSVFAIANTDT